MSNDSFKLRCLTISFKLVITYLQQLLLQNMPSEVWNTDFTLPVSMQDDSWDFLLHAGAQTGFPAWALEDKYQKYVPPE